MTEICDGILKEDDDDDVLIEKVVQEGASVGPKQILTKHKLISIESNNNSATGGVRKEIEVGQGDETAVKF